MSRLVIYSGPACVGKGPLRIALEKHYEEYRPGRVGKPVLYVSREPRAGKGETEGNPYHFRTVEQIQSMVRADPARYISGWIRDKEQFQALDLKETSDLLQKHSLVLLEVYYTLGGKLLEQQHQDYLPSNVETDSVFISPLSMRDICDLKIQGADLQKKIVQLMRRKLDRRETESEEKRQVRSEWAYTEMQNAFRYGQVVVSYDGEDSDNWGLPRNKDDDWSLPFPVGAAKRTLEAFVQVLQRGSSRFTEHWSSDVL